MNQNILISGPGCPCRLRSRQTGRTTGLSGTGSQCNAHLSLDHQNPVLTQGAHNLEDVQLVLLPDHVKTPVQDNVCAGTANTGTAHRTIGGKCCQQANQVVARLDNFHSCTQYTFLLCRLCCHLICIAMTKKDSHGIHQYANTVAIHDQYSL